MTFANGEKTAKEEIKINELIGVPFKKYSTNLNRNKKLFNWKKNDANFKKKSNSRHSLDYI